MRHYLDQEELVQLHNAQEHGSLGLELADSQVPIRSMEIGIKIEFKPVGAGTQTT